MSELQVTFRGNEQRIAVTPGGGLDLQFTGAPQQMILSVQGLQGPAGGGASARFEHVQGAASATWTVNHNLGFRPQVDVLSPGGVQVEAGVVHISDNQTVITFNTAQTGQAIFN